MKVVKKGRPQKGWAKKFKCTGRGNGDGGCGAELLVEEDDLFHTLSTALWETDYYITFRCSGCGVLTDISDRDATRHVRVATDLPHYSEWCKKHGIAVPRKQA